MKVEEQGNDAAEGAGTGAGIGAVAGGVVGGAAGGIVGAMIKSGVPEEDDNLYAKGVRRGGSVVAARVEDDKALVAQDILHRSRSVDIQERRALYSSEGWNRFDESAKPYTPSQIDEERLRFRNEPRL